MGPEDFPDPPLSQKAAVVLSSFGWMVGALASAGTVAWFRALKHALTRS